MLGVGLLGRFGRILEKSSRLSIQGLDHFSKTDAHATQYSLIAQSLLTTALEHFERQEFEERRRAENSSQLFGLMPSESQAILSSVAATPTHSTDPSTRTRLGGDAGGLLRPLPGPGPAYTKARYREGFDRDRGKPFWEHQGMNLCAGPGEGASGIHGLSESLLHTPPDAELWNGLDLLGAEAEAGSALNLFPLLEVGGALTWHITCRALTPATTGQNCASVYFWGVDDALDRPANEPATMLYMHASKRAQACVSDSSLPGRLGHLELQRAPEDLHKLPDVLKRAVEGHRGDADDVGLTFVAGDTIFLEGASHAVEKALAQ